MWKMGDGGGRRGKFEIGNWEVEGRDEGQGGEGPKSLRGIEGDGSGADGDRGHGGRPGTWGRDRPWVARFAVGRAGDWEVDAGRADRGKNPLTTHHQPLTHVHALHLRRGVRATARGTIFSSRTRRVEREFPRGAADRDDHRDDREGKAGARDRRLGADALVVGPRLGRGDAGDGSVRHFPPPRAGEADEHSGAAHRPGDEGRIDRGTEDARASRGRRRLARGRPGARVSDSARRKESVRRDGRGWSL